MGSFSLGRQRVEEEEEEEEEEARKTSAENGSECQQRAGKKEKNATSFNGGRFFQLRGKHNK